MRDPVGEYVAMKASANPFEVAESTELEGSKSVVKEKYPATYILPRESVATAFGTSLPVDPKVATVKAGFSHARALSVKVAKNKVRINRAKTRDFCILGPLSSFHRCAPSRTRTDTGRILSPLSLPLDYGGQ